MASSPGRRRLFLALVPWPLVLVAGFLASRLPSTAQTPQVKEAKLTKPRVPWTTSRVVGSPDPPPPFKVVRAFPNLKFTKPLLLARCPGSDRLFVGEEDGVLYSFKNTPDAKAELFCDLRKEINTVHRLKDARSVDSAYGLAFHPEFEKNRQCFVCYTLRGKKPGNLADGTRVSRFIVARTEPPRLDPASEEIVITFLQGGHNGGDIHFGPDRMLYISTGDATSPNPPDALDTGQDVSDLLSSILRIDVDHREPGSVSPGEPSGVSRRMSYAIPKDNPFVGMKGARPEIWAYGFRNPWRMSFDRQTGELFVGDVGWELWEMVHRIEKGGNYGWAAMEGPQPIKPHKVGPTPIRPALIELPHTIACSITGGYVYRGQKFPELRGAYVFGDWETRRLWAARFEGDRVKEMPEITRPSVRIVAFGEDNDGELYFLDHDAGTVHTLARNDGAARNSEFPTKLSETGLFASVKDHRPAPGVAPFAINSRQWQDGATAEHWAAFPGLSSATLHAAAKPIPGMVYWHNFRMHFPKDAVLMRTLSLGSTRVETQLLHYDGMDWRAYTFAWRDDQTDADLVPADGAEKEVGPASRTGPASGDSKRLWQFHSRSQCMSCHSNQSEYALSFLPEQLNRPGRDGRNQLVALTESGYVRRVGRDDKPLPPFDAGSAAREPTIADPLDARQPLEARARAYLHANCGHCHSDHGGGAVPLRLAFTVSPSKMNAVGERPTRGDFGLPDARIIKPGDPWASTLYYRMAKFGRDRMPHIGAERPDEAGLKLIENWITSMAGPASQAGPNPIGPPEKLLADSRSAMRIARQLGLGELKPAERDRLLTAAAKLPPGPIRDLFEGYLPDEKGARKLGSNPRPRAILALQGDAGRGEKLFWSEALKCGTCHKIGDRGTPLGPDLSMIGKLRPREELLESILEPSRRIEPKYAAYVAHVDDGRALSGLLVKRDEREVVLRDGQNKEVVVAAKNVEALRPARMSLMPDGQMASLTAQDAADLLEYIAAPGTTSNVFSRSNLVAWCIVPFDARNRGPAQRAEMVKRLGLSRVAYDWRDHHVAGFEEEILQYKKHGIEYFAFWATHDKAFELFAKHDLHPQIWQTAPSPAGASNEARVADAVKQLLPLVQRTAKMKCKLGLYNHGGWGGEPDNLVALCKALRDQHKAEHVGIVYNLHHGHGHIHDFAKALAAMQPYLLCLNLNGMATDGDNKGMKILPLGAGEHDLAMLKIIRASKYAGPIGIIGHTNDDVEQRLLDNLDGLDWLLRQLDGKESGPRPRYRTHGGK